MVYRPEPLTDLTAMRAFVDEAVALFQMLAAGTARVMGRQTPAPSSPPPLPA